ncbi:MAG: hypothetical protein O3C49_08710, partial [Proteobacteria bacterium]|nr:hypothetical protein [Pseudomonadota bacterium]
MNGLGDPLAQRRKPDGKTAAGRPTDEYRLANRVTDTAQPLEISASRKIKCVWHGRAGRRMKDGAKADTVAGPEIQFPGEDLDPNLYRCFVRA